MKTVSASYGIDSIPEDSRQRTWYHWHRFPLLPIVDIRVASEWNTARLSFSWLMLRFWTIDSFGLSLEVHFKDEGFYLAGSLPYVRWFFWLIPFPEAWQHKLMREPEGMKEQRKFYFEKEGDRDD
jgi:hypothetical protein